MILTIGGIPAGTTIGDYKSLTVADERSLDEVHPNFCESSMLVPSA
jgi:hypothetical protein